jgi:uncharacterized lipoprotein YajG
MKKTVVLFLTAVFVLAACNNDSTTETTRADSSAVQTVDSLKNVADSARDTMADSAALRK